MSADQKQTKVDDDDKTYRVHADFITRTDIRFTCPWCFKRYKKDGTPYVKAKRVQHLHGNGNNDMGNRIETRVPHCTDEGRDYCQKHLGLRLPGQFEIVITVRK